MNAPLSHAALAPVKASDLAALPFIEKWVSFATVSRDSNLALLDWTEAYLNGLGHPLQPHL
jgi:acetylornithine deacetylase